MKIRTLFVTIVFLISFLVFPVDSYSNGGGRGGVAMEAVDAGVDIMEVTMEVTVGVMEVVGVIIMDISFPESSVMAMVRMPTEAVAIHAIQG